MIKGAVGIEREGFYDKKLFDDFIETVGNFCEEAGRGADDPAETTSFVAAGIFG